MTDDQEPELESEVEEEFSLNPENDHQENTPEGAEEITEEIVADEKFTLETCVEEHSLEDDAQGVITDPDHGLTLSPVETVVKQPEQASTKPKPLETLFKQIHGSNYEEKRERIRTPENPVAPSEPSKVLNLVRGSDGTLMLPIRFKVINDSTHGPETSRGRDIIRKVCIDYRGGDLTMTELQKRVNRDITGKVRGTKDILSIIDIYAILAHAQAHGYYEPRIGKMTELQVKRRRSTSELTINEFISIVRYWRIKGATGTRPTALQCKENSEQLGLRKDLFLDPIHKILKALANRHSADYHARGQTPEGKRLNNLKFEALSNLQAVVEEIFAGAKRLINPRTGKNILVIECDEVICDPIKNQFLSINFPGIMQVFEDANNRNLKLPELDEDFDSQDIGFEYKASLGQMAVDTADIRAALDLAGNDVGKLIESDGFKQITDEEFNNMSPDEQREFLIDLKQERRETFRKMIE